MPLNSLRNRSAWILVAVTSAALAVAVPYGILQARGISAREMFELKEKFKLESVTQGTVTKRASGVIKEENFNTGVLLLLVEKVCDEKGGTGVAFANPYCKTKLKEQVDCSGKKIDRYRVEQRTASDSECPPAAAVTLE